MNHERKLTHPPHTGTRERGGDSQEERLRGGQEEHGGHAAVDAWQVREGHRAAPEEGHLSHLRPRQEEGPQGQEETQGQGQGQGQEVSQWWCIMDVVVSWWIKMEGDAFCAGLIEEAVWPSPSFLLLCLFLVSLFV